MKISKLILAVVSAAVLLGALTSAASAGRLSNSSQTGITLWRTLNFTGPFGTVECEVLLAGTYHSRTITKTAGSLIGYITAGTILGCRRGSATINQASFPWHRRYRSFSGTLPNITSIEETISGAEWTIREPTFGATCTVRAANGTSIGTYTREAGGAITRAAASSTANRCEGALNAEGTLSGSETNVATALTGGSRITVTLI